MEKDAHQKSEARRYFRNRFVKYLYFYSFLGLSLIVIANLIFSGVGLALDYGKNDAIWLIVSASVSGASLLLAGVLAGLTFVDSSAMSPKRIKATEILRVILRFFNALAGTFLFVTAYFQTGEIEDRWIPFLEGYGLLILTLEALIALYALWHMAWVAANPEKYTSPVGQDYLEASSPIVAKKKLAKPNNAKENTPSAEPVEVASSVKKKSPKK